MYESIEVARRSRSRRPVVAVLLTDPADAARREEMDSLDEADVASIGAWLDRPEGSVGSGVASMLYPEGGPSDRRLIVVGLGRREELTGQVVREAGARLLRTLWSARATRVFVELGDLTQDPEGGGGRLSAIEAAGALVDGLAAANFEFTEFKGAGPGGHGNGNGRGGNGGESLKLSVEVDASLRDAMATQLEVGRSAWAARRWGASPPNVANPDWFVSEARRLGRRRGLRVSVIDREKAERLGMGGLLGVGRAGSSGPAMVALRYEPEGRRKRPPILLVGKTITFDTGGYSLKSPSNMAGMKYDKLGGTAVLGAMDAIARLKPKVPVVGVLAIAENMVDQTAYRPDDILTMFNGVTVEVTNTDAEGRLVLADALAHGCREYRPQAVIDLATLTGGVVTALGSSAAGMFCGHRELRRRLLAAARASGEKLWPLPLWPEHRKQMQSKHADLVNSAGREAHPIQGAAFLSHFVCADGDFEANRPIPWAHLDIAGVATAKSDGPMYVTGPTGFGVRLLAQLVADWSDDLPNAAGRAGADTDADAFGDN